MHGEPQEDAILGHRCSGCEASFEYVTMFYRAYGKGIVQQWPDAYACYILPLPHRMSTGTKIFLLCLARRNGRSRHGSLYRAQDQQADAHSDRCSVLCVAYVVWSCADCCDAMNVLVAQLPIALQEC